MRRLELPWRLTPSASGWGPRLSLKHLVVSALHMTDTGTEGMTQYELAYLVTPLLPQANLDEEVAGMKRGIEAAGGVIVSHEAPKNRYLAYTITRKIANKNVRFTEAYFGWMRFSVMPGAVAAIETMLKKDENIVRHLLIVAPKDEVKEEKEAGASSVAGKEVLAAPEGGTPISDQELDREIDQMIAA